MALGVALVTIADGFVLAAPGMFLSGVGGAFTGSLILYTVAVKGCVRFRGALVGALALGFSVRLQDLAFALGCGDWATTDQLTIQSTPWWPMGLVLSAGILLLLLLPRWFQGTYGPGPSLRETLAVSGVKVLIGWVAAVYLAAEVVLAGGGSTSGGPA